MGICLHNLPQRGPAVMTDTPEFVGELHVVAWVCFRREIFTEEGPKGDVFSCTKYHLQGIALPSEGMTAEQVALNFCRDEDYIIGPIPVNMSLDHEALDWPGSYFPLAQQEETQQEEASKE